MVYLFKLEEEMNIWAQDNAFWEEKGNKFVLWHGVKGVLSSYYHISAVMRVKSFKNEIEIHEGIKIVNPNTENMIWELKEWGDDNAYPQTAKRMRRDSYKINGGTSIAYEVKLEDISND